MSIPAKRSFALALIFALTTLGAACNEPPEDRAADTGTNGGQETGPMDTTVADTSDGEKDTNGHDFDTNVPSGCDAIATWCCDPDSGQMIGEPVCTVDGWKCATGELSLEACRLDGPDGGGADGGDTGPTDTSGRPGDTNWAVY